MGKKAFQAVLAKDSSFKSFQTGVGGDLTSHTVLRKEGTRVSCQKCFGPYFLSITLLTVN